MKTYEEDVLSLRTEIEVAKGIMKDLIDNAPTFYAGTDIELKRRKMSRFQDAITKAKTFIKD